MRDLVRLSSRNTTQPIYHDIKSLICCDGWQSTQDLSIAWTVVGSLAFVLGLLCIWRLVRYRHIENKKAKENNTPDGAISASDTLDAAADVETATKSASPLTPLASATEIN